MIGPYNSYCAAGRDPDPQPRARRAAGDDQPDQHPPRADPRRLARTAMQRRAGASTTRPASATTSGSRPATTCRARRSRCWRSGSGCERVYVLDDGSSFWKGLLTNPFRARPREGSGVGVAGSATFDPQAKNYDALVGRIARSGADGVVVGGDPFDGGDRLVKALRARLGERVTHHGRLLLRLRSRRAGAGRPRRARDVRDDARPAARRPPPDRRSGRRFAREIGAPGHAVRACWRPARPPSSCWTRSRARTARAPPCSRSCRRAR